MTRRVHVADQSDLWPGEMVGLSIRGENVLLMNVEGRIHAYKDRCAHLGVRLSEGRLEGCTLVCRAHHWEYDARTGEGQNPRGVALHALPVFVRDGAIYLDLPSGHDG